MKKILLAVIFLAIAGFAIYIFTQKDPYSTNEKEYTNFAIADTASVGKIFIADTQGNTITLERGQHNAWTVNGKYPAREDGVQVLLKTFRDIYVQRPVPKGGEENVNKIMAGASKKVEIFNREGEWIKTWYVGYGTMDKKGTMMILETESGISRRPYIMDMKGFIGMLDTRFFTNLNEWRSTRIFQYTNMGLSEISVNYPAEPANSFKIEYNGGNNISLYSLYPREQQIEDFDTLKVKDYMLNFKKGSFENYNTRFSDAQIDSVKSLQPLMIIDVKAETGGEQVTLWTKKPAEGQTNNDGTPALIDKEYFYGANSAGELATAQRYIWDNFYVPLSHFLKQ